MSQKKPTNFNLMQLLQLSQQAGMESRAEKPLKLQQLMEGGLPADYSNSISKELSSTIIDNAIKGKAPFPFRFQLNPEDITGPILLGQHVNYLNSQYVLGHPVGLYILELGMHMMISGGTGTGKTNFGAYGLPAQIHYFNSAQGLEGDDRIGIFFFQTIKTDEDYIANINPDTIFLNSDNLKINPLYHHEGHDKERIFKDFTKLAAEVLFFREGGANQIFQALEQLDYKFSGKPFSLFELFEQIKKVAKNNRYEGVLENRFSGLLSGKSQHVFDCIRGLPFERLAHEFVIINLTDLDFYSQQFISIWIYQYLTEHFKSQ